MANTQDKNFKVSELPKIADTEIDNLDLLLISDKAKNGKFYTKQMSIQQVKDTVLDEIVIDGGGAVES